MRVHAGIAAALAAAVFAVFAPVRDHEFVDYDDPVYRVVVRPGLSAEGIRRAFTDDVVANWIPITVVSMLADQTLHGGSARGFLLGNVALHATATATLYLALVLATGATLPSAFVAGVFGLHPLHVESVAWVSQRKDVLCGVFFMACLLAHVRRVQRPRPGAGALVFATAAFAMLAKPTAVTLPFVLLLLDDWPLRRLRAPGVRWPRREALLAALREKLPLFALSAVVSVVTYQVQAASGAVAERAALPPGQRVGNALVAITAYLQDAVWPSGLAVFYPHPREALPPLQLAAIGGALLGVTALLLVASRRQRYLATGWLWFLGMLVPVLGLVQVGEQARADRYTYLPLVGLALMAGFGAAALAERWRRLRVPLAATGLALLLALGLAARAQVHHWRDSLHLYARARAVTGPNAFAERGLGRALLRAGRPEAAGPHLQRAAVLAPEKASVYVDLGDVRRALGDEAGAIRDYHAALARDPDDVRTRVNLGQLLLSARRFEEARETLETAFSQAAARDAALPRAYRVSLHLGLARAALALGDAEAARAHAQAALGTDERSAAAHALLAELALRAGDRKSARSHANAGLALARQQGDEGLVQALSARLEAAGDAP